MWKWTPSAVSMTPIRSKNAKASVFTVGFLDTNFDITYASASMMPTEINTATTMTESASAMPTAVITLSKLNTKSISITWRSTAPKLAVLPCDEWSS